MHIIGLKLAQFSVSGLRNGDNDIEENLFYKLPEPSWNANFAR